MPIFVPYTENEELVKRFKKKAKGSGIDVVFIERTGYSIQNQLERADPYEEDSCERECFPCEEEGGGLKCEMRGAGYDIICKACVEVVRTAELVAPAEVKGANIIKRGMARSSFQETRLDKFSYKNRFE